MKNSFQIHVKDVQFLQVFIIYYHPNLVFKILQENIFAKSKLIKGLASKES